MTVLASNGTLGIQKCVCVARAIREDSTLSSFQWLYLDQGPRAHSHPTKRNSTPPPLPLPRKKQINFYPPIKKIPSFRTPFYHASQIAVPLKPQQPSIVYYSMRTCKWRKVSVANTAAQIASSCEMTSKPVRVSSL